MHVLIVDDEKEIAELLKARLEEENHSVSLALNGHYAVDVARTLEYDAFDCWNP